MMFDLTGYLTQKLNEFGYTNMKVEYSLNWCQGDGCRFLGTLSREDIESQILTDRFLAENARGIPGVGFVKEVRKKRYQHKFKSLVDIVDGYGDIRIEIISTDSRYCHENTMSVTHNWDVMDIEDTYGDEAGLPNTDVAMNFEAVQERYLDWLAEDIVSVALKLKCAGYSILNEVLYDTVLWRFKTERYEFLLEALDYETPVDLGQDEYDFQLLSQGNHNCGNLKLSVFERCDDCEITSVYRDAQIWKKGDRTFAGLRKEMFQELRDEL